MEDDNEHYNGDEGEQEEEDIGDEDFVVNDYAGEDGDEADEADEGNSGINEEDEDIFDGIVEIDFVQTSITNFVPKHKRTSGITKLTKYEYSVLYGKIAQYIQQGKLTIPEGLLKDPEINSGDVFRMSRRWIQMRTQFPIPFDFQRMLFPGNVEKQNPSNLKTDEDFDFKDDHDDTERFYYNFRSENYDTSS